MHHSYTINCDLGEGVPNEASIIPLIDLASIACGGHFGDRDSIRTSLKLVKKFGKRAGAHPSYPDRENFGRRSLSIHPDALIESLQNQISQFSEIAKEENVELDHIKFHGALYNDAAQNGELAEILINFLIRKFPKTPLLVPPHSEVEKIALRSNLPIKREIFGDRAYQNDFKLVSRSVNNSLFTQQNQVFDHLNFFFQDSRIRTYSGEFLQVQADTICFHGDNPGIMEFLPFVRKQFWK
jgi:5-oxoprolinase (ATP-hydrolysing) subunit A